MKLVYVVVPKGPIHPRCVVDAQTWCSLVWRAGQTVVVGVAPVSILASTGLSDGVSLHDQMLLLRQCHGVLLGDGCESCPTANRLRHHAEEMGIPVFVAGDHWCGLHDDTEVAAAVGEIREWIEKVVVFE